MDREFDASMPNFMPSTERRKVVDFSRPAYTENPGIITRFPHAADFSIWSIFGFSYKSWFLILGTIFVIGLLSSIFDWFQTSDGGEGTYNYRDKTGRLSFKR